MCGVTLQAEAVDAAGDTAANAGAGKQRAGGFFKDSCVDMEVRPHALLMCRETP